MKTPKKTPMSENKSNHHDSNENEIDRAKDDETSKMEAKMIF